MLATLAHLFTPRHTNNHRARALHFAGLTIFTGLMLLANTSIELLKTHTPDGFVLGYASNISANQVLVQTNEQRAQAGLSPLTLNDKLSQAARAKANDMFTNNYWAHTSPAGSTPWTFIKGAGYRYTVAGENLARDFDDTSSMVSAWMNSPTHKANVVHPRYTETGIAVVNGTLDGVETTLVVHMFGTPSTVAAAPAQNTPPQIASGQEATVPTAIPTPIPEPQDLTTPTLEPSVLSQSQPTSRQATYISPKLLKESMAIAIVGLLISILIFDELIIQNKKTIRFVGRNLAHLSFLAFVLVVVLSVSRQGGII